MTKLLKLTFLSALLLFAIVGSTNAAFPKEKQNATATVINSTNELTEATATKSELKKELTNLNKENSNNSRSGGSKSKIVAALLALFLGTLGIHSFYMGQTTKGIIQAGVTVLGIVLYVVGIASFISSSGAALPITALVGAILIFGVSIWAFIDFIRILTGGLAPAEGFND